MRLLFVVLFFLTSGLAVAADDGDIIGHRYVLARINGEPASFARDVFVEIDSQFGLTGRICNTFRGPADYREGILKAGNLASTRMLCLDENLSKLENDLFQALRDGVSLFPVPGGIQWRRDDNVWEFTLADATE
jgi:heat shock protein HslJ